MPTHSNSLSVSKGFSWANTDCKSDCSWFGFKISIKENAPFTRTDLAKELDKNKIGNRMLFGGNLIRQSAFIKLKDENPDAYRIVDDTKCSDAIMNKTLFLGTYPGLTKSMMDFEIDVINNYISQFK